MLGIIGRVPPGAVTTYGEVARFAGLGRRARFVGHVLARLDPSEAKALPWHRVVNAAGGISLRPGHGATRQRTLLEAEGHEFDAAGRLELGNCRWQGPTLEDLVAVGWSFDSALAFLSHEGDQA